MDDHRETTPEKSPAFPYAGLPAPSRDQALWHACEALLAAREAVDALPEATDRTYALDQIAHRWLELADRLEPQGAEKGQEGGVEGRAPGSGYPGVGQAVPESQAGAQEFVDHPVYDGVEYPMESRWMDREYDVWVVTGVTSDGLPLMTGPDGPDGADSPLSVRRVLELYAPLTRV